MSKIFHLRESHPCVSRLTRNRSWEVLSTKESDYKNYEELPLFLNSETVAKVLGVSPSSGYELMHEPGFPVLRIGNRMVVPKNSSSNG